MSINLDIRTLLTSINSNRSKRRPSIRSWMVEFGRGSQGKLTWDGWMVSWHFSGDPQPVFFFIFFFLFIRPLFCNRYEWLFGLFVFVFTAFSWWPAVFSFPSFSRCRPASRFPKSDYYQVSRECTLCCCLLLSFFFFIFIFTSALEYCAFYSCLLCFLGKLLWTWKFPTWRGQNQSLLLAFLLPSVRVTCAMQHHHPFANFPPEFSVHGRQLHFACHSANGVVFSSLFPAFLRFCFLA